MAAISPLPLYSVVVPVMNEAGNILPLASGIAAAIKNLADYEIIFVDDVSRDTTVAEIMQARALNPNVRLVRHAENRGQSQALRTGAEAARGTYIITLDGDGQNPPSEIPKLIAALNNIMLASDSTEPNVAVCGIREKRQDSMAKKRASRWANKIRQNILKDDCPDTGCGLKLFPRAAFLRLPFFNHIHRYLPALFKAYGLPVSYVGVGHAPRTIGQSKYTNWQRALVGAYDLFGVSWLIKRTRPVRAWEE